jgi:hypothetical protein
VAELASRRKAVEATGTQLAFVHMGNAEQGAVFFAQYGLGDVPHFSDPDCLLYRTLGLRRAPLGLFLKFRNWRRAYEGLRAGHGVGLVVGDGLRMPGVFLLRDGAVLRGYRHEYPSDRPDYVALATCDLDTAADARTPKPRGGE